MIASFHTVLTFHVTKERRMVELYLHSPIYIHGILVNFISYRGHAVA
jgi:hypothetical protein